MVQKGDTLWDISARFLKDPWVWPAIWDVNPQIANPHLIYPGDVISLVYIDGRPILVVDQGDGQVAIDLGQTSSGKPIVKLSPRVRSEALDQAIPVVPADAIEQFTVNPQVLTKEQLDAAIDKMASPSGATGDLRKRARSSYQEHWTVERHLKQYLELIESRRGSRPLPQASS